MQDRTYTPNLFNKGDIVTIIDEHKRVKYVTKILNIHETDCTISVYGSGITFDLLGGSKSVYNKVSLVKITLEEYNNILLKIKDIPVLPSIYTNMVLNISNCEKEDLCRNRINYKSKLLC